MFNLLKIGVVLLGFVSDAIAQDSISLEDCYTLAKENYPLIKQQDLIRQTMELNIDNLSKGYLPQISLNGQATYQSQVTELPVSIPNIEVPSLSKDQYKIYADVYQNIYDGHSISKQKQIAVAHSDIENEKIEVELFKLKEHINQLFFGILLIDARDDLTDLLYKDIQNALNKTNAAIKNGIALPSNASMLQAELLKINQKKTELIAQRKAFIAMLSLMINREITDTKFSKPLNPSLSEINTRPELKLFEAQKNIIVIQNELLSVKNSIKVGLFAQLGYGRPGFNFLSNSFSPYYIAGVRFNWNLSNLYTTKNEKSILLLNKRSIEIQKDVFLRNIELSIKQQDTEIEKYRDLIGTDAEIILLREKILRVSDSQLSNGTITTIDYLANINALDQAKQNQLLHELQLLQIQINYQNSLGN